MNIRPKNEILYAQTGVKFSLNNLNGTNWQNVFNGYKQHILDLLSKYGEADDYGQWLNEMQSRHSKIYNLAGGEKGNWLNVAYRNELVRLYQLDYRGGLDSKGVYKRYGNVLLNDNDRYDFNSTGIKPNLATRYNITNPPSRTSGDFSRTGHEFDPDGLYSAITDDRRLLGRVGDWDETSQEFKDWLKQLNDRGWETYKDDSDGYYKLRRLNAPPVANQNTIDEVKKETPNGIDERQKADPESPWAGIASKLKTAVPDILDAIRLAGNLNNNERVYNAVLKGIRPNLLDTYRTARLLVGDEATKQGYYRRAAEGETKASQAITSDMDRLIAYLMEAKRIGDEARAQGDLADNAEIRRTSDESNQHQWANILRATEVANRNAIELNAANLAKQNLLALKYASNWSNWDNYLMGIQNKLEQLKLEEKAYLRLLALLGVEEGMLDDEVLTDLTMKRALLYDKWYNSKDETEKANYYKQILELSKEIKKKSIEILKLQLKALMAKSGTKIEYKADDKYLYKTARDVVDHFRKMSKMMDDSRIKSRTKPIKLSSHPKGTRKMQQGGIAPFTVYRPLGIGGQSAVSSQTSSSESSSKSSKKDNAEKDKLDAIKKLFEVLTNGKGLPTDVNSVYKDINLLFLKSKLFGEEMSTDDIASLYLNSIQKISNLKYSLDNYDKILQNATARDALDEYAVTADGRYIVLNRDTKDIEYASSLLELKEKNLNPITNRLLLYLRAYSSDLALYKGDDLVNNVDNGMGINKIGAQIKALAGNISTTEEKLEGISLVESGKVKAGILILTSNPDLVNAPDGHYKITTETKTQKEQVNAALNFIYNTLSPSLKAILNIHGGVENNIIYYLTSQTGETRNISILPLTGKASDKGLGSGEKGDISSNPLLDMQREIGGMYLNYSLVTKDSNTKLSVNGTFYSLLPKISEDMSIDKMLSVSGIGGIIQGKRGITFGNLEIKPEDLKHIMYSNNGGMVVTLPCKIVNGIKLVNLDVVETYEKAEQKALQVNSDRNSPQFIQALALELKNEHLDSLLDSNGLPNKNMFGQFLVVDAYTSDKIKFDINSKYIEKIENPDEELELRMSKALNTDNKKSDYALDVKDHWTIFEGTWDDIYKGTVFIPLNNNPNAALNTWGNSAKIGQTTELEELYLISNKSSKFNGNNTLE